MTGGYDLYPTALALTLFQHVAEGHRNLVCIFIHILGAVEQAVKVNTNPQK